MKQRLAKLLQQAATALTESGVLSGDPPAIQIERARDPRHGDYASNLALMLAKQAGMPPRDLATLLVERLPADPIVAAVEIAGPGFINFRLAPAALHHTVTAVLEQGEGFGRSRAGGGQKVQVEFVSANPTGPLHIGHGRGAAHGMTMANLLQATGFDVQREYYVNDAGRQMDILAFSLWLRYLERLGVWHDFPENAYRGSYVRDLAVQLEREHGDRFRVEREALALLEDFTGDDDALLDAGIARMRELLGEEDFRLVHAFGLERILEGIREDLASFGVHYDCWFSERSLSEQGAIERALETLEQAGHLYRKEGALWFRSTAFGDDKDRVVVRENGETTYFASDIAYHLNKLERGFERVIDVWGADHHGYVPRVKAALQALGKDPARLEVLLVQFAVLYRGNERLQMSTRSGEFVTLRELCEEVGTDAARFFYCLRRCEQHLDFDLELAKSQSSDNPVYYIQYAHARICSVQRQLGEKGMSWKPGDGASTMDRLTDPRETALMKRLMTYPEVIEAAALNREPHLLPHYLRDLANDFHTCYNAVPFLVEEEALRNARLDLLQATAQVIRNGLSLLGVSAPEAM
ncbi:MAG: arginine--tRNA ligase [Gammaproteobacteria bacterium]|nr:MAG: arginine--tRNA ligase [Gammaproteobacteria bacterium]